MSSKRKCLNSMFKASLSVILHHIGNTVKITAGSKQTTFCTSVCGSFPYGKSLFFSE